MRCAYCTLRVVDFVTMRGTLTLYEVNSRHLDLWR
jgi:hypothetical protein